MTERTLIEVNRDRRTMAVRLSESEQTARGSQVFSENAARRKLEAEQAALEGEAKAKREEAKAVAERVAQKQALIDALAEAARTGIEQRPVEVVFSFDPTCGEVIGTRADTSEEVERRKPTAEDWDEIRRVQQLPLPTAPPVEREPAKVLTLVPPTPEQATTAAAETITEDGDITSPAGIGPALLAAEGPPKPSATLAYPIHPSALPADARQRSEGPAEPPPLTHEEAAELRDKARALGQADRRTGGRREGVLNVLKGTLPAREAGALLKRLTTDQAAAIEDAYDAGAAEEPEAAQEPAQEEPEAAGEESQISADLRARIDSGAISIKAAARESGLTESKLRRLLGKKR